MKHYRRLAVAVTIVMTITAACSSAAPVATTTPTPTVAPPAATATLVATAAPTGAPPTAAPGPTQIPYPGPSIPAGTLTVNISAQNIAFDKTDLAAPPNTPFVIAFDNKDPDAHNVAIRLGNTILFNPLPAIVGPSHADYFIPEGLAAGTYKFFCIVHPNMQGDLTIS